MVVSDSLQLLLPRTSCGFVTKQQAPLRLSARVAAAFAAAASVAAEAPSGPRAYIGFSLCLPFDGISQRRQRTPTPTTTKATTGAAGEGLEVLCLSPFPK